MSYIKSDLRINIIIGERLRNKREGLGLTATDTSNLIGVALSTILNWESGKHNISLSNLYRYCCILRIHPSEILPTYNDYKPRFIKSKKNEKEISNCKI